MSKSQYFANLFQYESSENITLFDVHGDSNKILYEIFFNFMHSDWLVVPDNVSAETYIQLILLADYFCVPLLTQLCCNELITMLTTQNV